MKKLLDVLNKNLGTNFQNVAEFGANAKKLDIKTIAETLYQYMNYQETIDKVDMDIFKVRLNIEKDK